MEGLLKIDNVEKGLPGIGKKYKCATQECWLLLSMPGK
jgi:hypothetical protein